jgi:hypothetical protein
MTSDSHGVNGSGSPRPQITTSCGWTRWPVGSSGLFRRLGEGSSCGGVDPAETLTDTAIRVVAEETSIVSTHSAHACESARHESAALYP